MTRMPPTARSSADVRRRQAVACAAAEFARRGFRGASTQTIARQAGISQPYLFRLVSSKHALFLDVLTHAFDLLQAAQPHPGKGAASARRRLLRGDGGQLAQLLLQGCAAACDDEQVADLLRSRLGQLAAHMGCRGQDVAAELLRPVIGPILLPAARGALSAPTTPECAEESRSPASPQSGRRRLRALRRRQVRPVATCGGLVAGNEPG